MDQEVFQKNRVRWEKLEPAGFVYSEGQYLYHEQILDGDFEVRVQIDEKGLVSSQVIDMDLEEEYRAVQVPTEGEALWVRSERLIWPFLKIWLRPALKLCLLPKTRLTV